MPSGMPCACATSGEQSDTTPATNKIRNFTLHLPSCWGRRTYAINEGVSAALVWQRGVTCGRQGSGRFLPIDNIERDRREPGEVKLPCGGGRHVYDPAFVERTPVIDPHNDRAAVAQIGDANHGAERQGAVRGREFGRGKRFTARGRSALSLIH